MRFVGTWLLPVTLATGCVFGLPPSRTEVGRTWSEAGPRTRVAFGAHLGSAIPLARTRLELGAGLLYDSATEDAMTPAPSRHGGYVDVGVVPLRSSFARMIVGARGEEYWSGDAGNGYAVKLRVDLELVGHEAGDFSEADGCSAIAGTGYGNVGLGAYAEAGRAFGDDPSGWSATVGMTVRLPAFVGVAIGGGCHHGGDRGSSGSGSGGSLGHIIPQG